MSDVPNQCTEDDPEGPFYLACWLFVLCTWGAVLGYATSSPDLFSVSVGIVVGSFCFIAREALFGGQ